MDKVGIFSLNISDAAKRQLAFAGVKSVDTLCGLSFDQLYLLGISEKYFNELDAVIKTARSNGMGCTIDDDTFEDMLSNFRFKAQMSGVKIPMLKDRDNDASGGYIDEFEPDDKMNGMLADPVTSDGLAELLKMADEKLDGDSNDDADTSGVSANPGELGDLLQPGMFATAVEIMLDPNDINGSVDNLDAPDVVKDALKGILGSLDIDAMRKQGSGVGVAGIIRGRTITNEDCIVCGSRLRYSKKYGALYCPTCDAWRSAKCVDPDCWACNNRPDKPSDDEDLDAEDL